MAELLEIMQSSPPEERVVLDVPVPDHVPKELVRDLRAVQGLRATACPEPYSRP